MRNRKLPVGLQDFKGLIQDGYVYVDKTRFIHALFSTGKYYFSSRPRRFGKSLFLSTMRYYFLGERELFGGLAIEELMKDDPEGFVEYPVFYFDFNGENYLEENALEETLDFFLRKWEAIYGTPSGQGTLSRRFQSLLAAAHERTGRRTVILVDEYDKPLLDALSRPDLLEHNRAVFKGFFGALKSCDEHIRFAFITGVTKFTKVSLFSDLNNLTDISMHPRYTEICGITEKELRSSFLPEIQALAEANALSEEECFAELKQRYDGYHFHPRGAGVYNPVSLLRCFDSLEFGAYWFDTATPTMLIEKLQAAHFDLRDFTDGHLRVTDKILSNYLYDSDDPIPLFYQTGYLTIRDFDSRSREYVLGYPNEEVEYAFLESLAPAFLYRGDTGDPLSIFDFLDDIRNGDLEGLRDRFTAIFARLPYSSDERYVERDFQNVVYITFMLLGQRVHVEQHSARGRADAVVETEEHVYLFEFKRDGTAAEALRQIEERGYALPYAADPRQVYCIGISFSSGERNIVAWESAIRNGSATD